MQSNHIKILFGLCLILGTSAMRASDTMDKVKVGSALIAGIAAGAATGTFMPGPLPAKIIAGAATTALVTPCLLLVSVKGRFNSQHSKTWQDKLINITTGTILLGYPIAVPILALTAGICVGNQISANVPIKILTGSSVAMGIIAIGVTLWGAIAMAAGMAGGTGAAG